MFWIGILGRVLWVPHPCFNQNGLPFSAVFIGLHSDISFVGNQLVGA